MAQPRKISGLLLFGFAGKVREPEDVFEALRRIVNRRPLRPAGHNTGRQWQRLQTQTYRIPLASSGGNRPGVHAIRWTRNAWWHGEFIKLRIFLDHLIQRIIRGPLLGNFPQVAPGIYAFDAMLDEFGRETHHAGPTGDTIPSHLAIMVFWAPRRCALWNFAQEVFDPFGPDQARRVDDHQRQWLQHRIHEYPLSISEIHNLINRFPVRHFSLVIHECFQKNRGFDTVAVVWLHECLVDFIIRELLASLLLLPFGVVKVVRSPDGGQWW